MKKQLHKLLVFLLLATIAASCAIKEDMSDCPPETTGVWLEFECIEIYDTGDREIVFEKVTDELELLFYDNDGMLVYDKKYTAEQLAANNWGVYLEEELPGTYTLLAHVNYNNQHYKVTGKESIHTLISEIEYDNNNTIDYPLTDTYYGKYDLELAYDCEYRNHKIMLSKNTNFVNVTVKFDDEEGYKAVTSVESHISGPNAIYGWENIALTNLSVFYMPYRSSFNDDEMEMYHQNKTMRITHGEDLKIRVNITILEGTITETLDIPLLLSRIEKYDTNAKLEHYDEFNFEITLNGELVMIVLKVNGWYLKQGGVDI